MNKKIFRLQMAVSKDTFYQEDAMNLQHRFWWKLFGLVFLLLALQTFLSAATYYVAKTGSDNNSGTQATPWLTIQKAANMVVAGDTVLIQTGTYNELVTEKTNGTSDSHITYKAQGAVTVGGFAISGAYVDGSGFTFSGYGVGTADGVLSFGSGGNYCSWSNCSYTETVSLLPGPRGITMSYSAPFVTGCTFDNVDFINLHGNSLILIGTNHTYKNSTIVNVNDWDLIHFYGNGIKIQNNDLSLSNPNGNDNHGDFFQTFNGVPGIATHNVMIEGNTCRGAGTDDVQLGDFEDNLSTGNVKDVTFKNNTFLNTSRTANIKAPGFKFLNNTFYRCGAMSQAATLTLFNDASKGSAHNTTIRDNIFFECGVATNSNYGWYIKDAVTGLDADHNLVVGAGAGTTKTGFSEVNSINGKDPLFVDAAAGIFSLKSGSPAIGMGINTLPTNAKAVFK